MHYFLTAIAILAGFIFGMTVGMRYAIEKILNACVVFLNEEARKQKDKEDDGK